MAIHHPRPPESIDLSNARQVMLDVVNARASQGPGYFQSGPILQTVSQRLGVGRDTDAQQAILTLWHDLFRIGMLAPGYDLSSPDLPFVHLTDSGRRSLQNISRDPSNPDGYLCHLRSEGFNDPIADSYIEEAVLVYSSGCYKSVAVMVGCATERLVLIVRNELVDGFTRQSNPVPGNLTDWRYKTVRDAITAELDANRPHMTPQRLKEAYSAFWMPLTEQLRLYRNDAGHPQSITPVTPETVHSNLLIFPELARLASDVVAWIKAYYV